MSAIDNANSRNLIGKHHDALRTRPISEGDSPEGASGYCQSCSAHNDRKGTYGIEVPDNHTTESSLKSYR